MAGEAEPATRQPRERASWMAKVPIAPEAPAMKTAPSWGMGGRARSARSVVFAATGTAAAFSKVIASGIARMSESPATTAYSAQVPPLSWLELTYATRSPTE